MNVEICRRSYFSRDSVYSRSVLAVTNVSILTSLAAIAVQVCPAIRLMA